MLVCHCMAVYERHVREEIARGVDDVVDLAEACGAGTVCGGCVPTMCGLLGQPFEDADPSAPIDLTRPLAPSAARTVNWSMA